MVAIIIGDRTYEVPVPLKLAQLELAAPHIDALNAKIKEDMGDAPVRGLCSNLSLMLAALLPGIQKADPSVTLDQLKDDFDPGKWPDLKTAFDTIFNSSGFSKGEAKAAVEPDPAAA